MKFLINANPVPSKANVNKIRIYSKLFFKLIYRELITFGENAASKESRNVVLFNENYEGEIKSTGSTTIDIIKDGDPATVRDYAIETGIVAENIFGSKISFVIANDVAINEIIDGYEEHTIPDKIIFRRLMINARALADYIDTQGVDVLQTSNNVLKQGQFSDQNVYTNLLKAQEWAMKNNIVFTALVMRPELHTMLKTSPHYTKNSDAGMSQAKSGYLGMVDGLPIVVSNKLDAKTQYILIDPDHATRVLAWRYGIRLNEIKDGKHIGASAIQARIVSEHFITNSKGVLVATNEAA